MLIVVPTDGVMIFFFGTWYGVHATGGPGRDLVGRPGTANLVYNDIEKHTFHIVTKRTSSQSELTGVFFLLLGTSLAIPQPFHL
jgi:hypothetical protein